MKNLKRIAVAGFLMGMIFGVMAFAGGRDHSDGSFNTAEDRAEARSEDTVVVRNPANEKQEEEKSNPADWSHTK